MKKFVFWIAGALLLLLVAGWCVWNYVNAPYKGTEPAWIYLPHGTTPAQLKDQLLSVLGPKTGSATMTVYDAAAAKDAQIYGAYRIDPGTSAKDIARRLVRHRQTPIRLTFNNVRTLPQLAERIGSQMEFSANEFLAALDSVLPQAGFKSKAEYPAAFLPDTYEFYWTTPPAATVEKLLATRNNFWNTDRRARAREMGITPVQAATLASIAEEETNNRRERGIVARLYLNRVHKSMKLQADPTVKFALGDFGLRRIRAEHLKVNSPYNTYQVNGLPPGPIRIADAATIDALLNSEPHNWIYMCAKEDFSGTHNFASDYATHTANARRYRQALNRRGIR